MLYSSLTSYVWDCGLKAHGRCVRVCACAHVHACVNGQRSWSLSWLADEQACRGSLKHGCFGHEVPLLPVTVVAQ